MLISSLAVFVIQPSATIELKGVFDETQGYV